MVVATGIVPYEREDYKKGDTSGCTGMTGSDPVGSKGCKGGRTTTLRKMRRTNWSRTRGGKSVYRTREREGRSLKSKQGANLQDPYAGRAGRGGGWSKEEDRSELPVKHTTGKRSLDWS